MTGSKRKLIQWFKVYCLNNVSLTKTLSLSKLQSSSLLGLDLGLHPVFSLPHPAVASILLNQGIPPPLIPHHLCCLVRFLLLHPWPSNPGLSLPKILLHRFSKIPPFPRSPLSNFPSTKALTWWINDKSLTVLGVEPYSSPLLWYSWHSLQQPWIKSYCCNKC